MSLFASTRLRAFAWTALRYLPLALALGVVVYRLAAFLAPGTLPARGGPGLPFQGSDLTPQFAVFSRVALDALWEHGTLAFWNPLVHSGAPLFETPQAGVLSLATWLGAALPHEAALKWAMVLHVLLGMAGVFSLARALKIEHAFAAVGALAFGLGPFLLDHFRVGHLNQVYPMGLMPWALLALWKALQEETAHRHRWAILAGALVGAQILEGGDVAILYEGVGISFVVATAVFGPARRAHLLRTVAAGALLVVSALAVAACQVLPMLSYMAVTNRGGGVSFDVAKGRGPEFAKLVPGTVGFVLMGIGVVVLLTSKRRRAALWFAALAGLGVAATYVVSVFELLWRYVPGFQFQRLPERSLVLVGVAGPVLIAAAAQLGWWHLSRRPAWRWLSAAATVGLVALLSHELWKRAPALPPMASVQRELQANHAMQYLAKHAQGSRVHVWETNNRHWGTEHVTAPLGLRVITGYTPSEHHDYLEGDFDAPGHRTFIGASYQAPARLWGMLNVRYVLSQSPRRVDGFRLATIVPRCPHDVCQPAKSAGPYIYENERWLPAAWVVPHAVALVGPARATFEASLDLMLLPAFDPKRVVVLHFTSPLEVPAGLVTFAAGQDVPGLQRWGTPQARAAFEAWVGGLPNASLVPAQVSRPHNNGLDVRADRAGWLVVSERVGLFAGWSARVDEPVRLHRANGVLGAVSLNAPATVTLRYKPPGFALGIGILVSCIVLLGAVEGWRARRRNKPLVALQQAPPPA